MNKIITALLILALTLGQAWSQAALLPDAKQQYFDNVGNPLASGTVTYYTPGSTNKKTTWQNSTETTNNANPVVLDSAGRAVIYGQGSYRQVVKDSTGVTIWDAVTTAYGSSTPAGATGTDTAPVGTVMPWAGFAIPTNWLLAYGQAVSRTTYSNLYAALTVSNTTVSCTSGSPTLSGFADTSQFRIGARVEATCIAPGTIISSVTNSSTIVVNNNAASNSTVTAVVFPWGNGDGSTTFNVPDLRGRVPAGADAMGGTSANRLTNAFYGVAANAPATAGGAQSHTMTTSELVSHTHTVNDPGHSHLEQTSTGGGAVTGVTGGTGINVTVASAISTTTVATGLTLSTAGSTTPFTLVQPSMTINYIIKAAPNSSGLGGVISLGGMFGDIICDGSFLCTNQAIGLATQLTGTVLGNVSATTLSPTGITFTQWMDYVCSSAQGALIYRSGSAWTCLAPGVAGQALETQGAGASPIWATIPGTGTVTSVALSLTTGIFTVSGSPVTTAGTISIGVSGTSGGVPYFNTASTISSSAALSPNSIIFGGGSGVSPSTSLNAYMSTAGTLWLGQVGSISGKLSLSGSSSNQSIIQVPAALSASTIFQLPSNNGTNGYILTTDGNGITSWSAASSSSTITVGTTTIASGTNTRILYDNSGTLGEYTLTGSGTVVAMQTNPSLITPTLGVASATTINKVTFTTPATGSTLTIADGKTLTASKSGTLAGGDAFVLAIAAAKTLTATSSLSLAGVDGKTLTVNKSGTLDGGDSFTLSIAASKTLTATSSLSLGGTDNKTLTVSNSGTLAGGDAFVLAIAASKTLTATNSLSLAGVDGKTLTINNSGSLSGGDNFSLAISASKTLTATNSLTLSGTDNKTLTVSNSGTLAGGDAFVLAIAAAKTLTATNSLTLSGTDNKTLTVSNSGTLAGGDAFILAISAAKTLTATNSLSLAGTDGKTLTVSNSGTLAGGDAFILAIAASKTLTVTNSLAFAGTDSTTMTFPSTSSTIPKVVASGAKALATGAISSAACTAAQTDTATGTLTTDAIIASFNGDPTAVTGYVPLTTGMLTIIVYPTADTVNFKVCNNTGSSITPGAITINWRVVR